MELDDIFRDKLQNREEMPTDHVWAKLSKMLDEQDEAKVIPLVPVARKATNWRVMYGAVASVLFLVAMLGVWYAGKEDSPVAKSEKSNKVGKPNSTDHAESVERLATNDAKDKTENTIENNSTNLTDPDPKNAKTEPTPTKTNLQTPAKTNLPTQTKPQQDKNNTPTTPPKSKTFRPAPTRTELIATEYEVKFKKIRIEIEGYIPFEEAVVTISNNEPPVLPVGKKRKKPRRYFYAKDEQQTKRKFKLLGINRDKMIAFIED